MAGYSKEQLRNIIARTLYRECMGTEGETGMRAVATVIFNRGNGIPTEMVNEIKKPRQFSCWNKMSPSDWMPEKFKIREYPNDKWWKLADGIAAEIVNGTFKPVADYDHYHTVSVSPYWSRGKTSQAVKIGNHYFFPSGVIA
jgi:spore germination cell wall hydrolase CwlJ-like protein